jgi:hypothetical protein
MITKRELQKLKDALPSDGYTKIEEKTGIQYQLIVKSFNDPKRFKKEVIEAALEVIKEYKAEVLALKSQIKTIAS